VGELKGQVESVKHEGEHEPSTFYNADTGELSKID